MHRSDLSAPLAMATTPPSSPLNFAATKTRVQSWVEQLRSEVLSGAETLSPPSTPVGRKPLKRKRASLSTMSARASSPKRPRRDSDAPVTLPTRSASETGIASNASALLLNETNTFSPPGSQASTRSPRRTNSPLRNNVAVLASATPPTVTEPSSGLKSPPHRRVRDVMDRLEAGLEKGWIPSELQELIRDDADFGYQRIERQAWDESSTQTCSRSSVDNRLPVVEPTHILKKVKAIWLNARSCQSKGRDENAWCIEVVLPLMKLALKLEDEGKFWLQSVQSQSIAPEFLSSVSDASRKPRLLDRKADYTLSFSHMPTPGFEHLYSRLRDVDCTVVSHMADAFTRTTALFSCVEVKPADGDHTEAETQLSVWMAASLRKKMQLARRVGLVDKSGLVEPCLTIVGHKTQVYFAFMESEEKDAVHILGPEDGPLSLCETRSVSGIFRALRLWRNLIAYGKDTESAGFWGGFMGEVLWKLAGDATVHPSASRASAAESCVEGR